MTDDQSAKACRNIKKIHTFRYHKLIQTRDFLNIFYYRLGNDLLCGISESYKTYKHDLDERVIHSLRLVKLCFNEFIYELLSPFLIYLLNLNHF